MGGVCVDGAVQQIVERSFDVFRCESKGVHGNRRKKSVPSEWNLNSHLALTDGSWNESVLIHEFHFDDKTNSTNAWFVRILSLNGVFGANYFDAAFGKPNLVQSYYIDAEASTSLAGEGCSSFRVINVTPVLESAHVPGPERESLRNKEFNS